MSERMFEREFVTWLVIPVCCELQFELAWYDTHCGCRHCVAANVTGVLQRIEGLEREMNSRMPWCVATWTAWFLSHAVLNLFCEHMDVVVVYIQHLCMSNQLLSLFYTSFPRSKAALHTYFKISTLSSNNFYTKNSPIHFNKGLIWDFSVNMNHTGWTQKLT